MRSFTKILCLIALLSMFAACTTTGSKSASTDPAGGTGPSIRNRITTMILMTS